MAQLHETGYGRRLFEHELPQLNKSLERIATALENLSKKEEEVVLNSSTADIIPLLKSIKLKDIFSARVVNCLWQSWRFSNLYEFSTISLKS